MIRFSFIDSKTGYIELLLQDSDICHGWYIEPHMEPLKVNNECLKSFHFMMNIVTHLVSYCECLHYITSYIIIINLYNYYID